MKVTRPQILKRVRYWKNRLHLSHWMIVVECGEDTENHSDASCCASPEYLQATLRFDLDKVPPDKVDAFVVHELCHCHVAALANFGNSACRNDPVKLEALRHHEELLVTTIERLVLALTGKP